MLAHLSIHQFALIESLELEFRDAMAVITGETGAGKSILLDALGMALGQRADAECVRQNAKQADISAAFTRNPQADHWLREHSLDNDEELIILRRVISPEGRSRAYVNGRAVTAGDQKSLAQYLIDIHSQHAHQTLLQKDTPRNLLDAFANLKEQTRTLAQHYRTWQQHKHALEQLEERSSEFEAQVQLLSYQVNELREMSLDENELNQLEDEQKRLANAEQTLLSSQQAMALCQGDDNSQEAAISMVFSASQALASIKDEHPDLVEAKNMLQQAHIQLDEASRSLHNYLDAIDINPHRLQTVDDRLSELYTMARKHGVQPHELYAHWQQQEQALAELTCSDADLNQRREELATLEATYNTLASTLSTQRKAAAKSFDAEVCAHFESLGLAQAKLETRFESLPTPQRHGQDDIQLWVQTNPGMPWTPLAKSASGGELSRMSLAIQVVCAASQHTPSLIFDEVDVGIGGSTAERVGRLMRQLGQHVQVMCVTHQPQVASQAHQHFQVSKINGDNATHTRIRELDGTARQEEIARMLGGVDITQSTLDHAHDMLSRAN